MVIGRPERRAVVEKDEDGKEQIAIRTMLTSSLTCDHRFGDGAQLNPLLRAIRNYVEDPENYVHSLR